MTWRFCAVVAATVVLALALPGAASLRLVQVDLHARLYPDRAPVASSPIVSAPRGAPLTLQFALLSDREGEATLSAIVDGAGMSVRVHYLAPVHVEGNTQGSLKNRPGGPVPEGWMKHLIRPAPFDTLEVLVESDTMPVYPGQTNGIVLEVNIPADAAPGVCRGRLRVRMGEQDSTAEFSFHVYAVRLRDGDRLHCVHWLWPEPVNLVQGTPPDWWSEAHWRALENSMRQLRRFGDDTLYTPLVNHRESLIRISCRADGSYAFDYQRFDRWVRIARQVGYRYLAGQHLVALPAKHMGGVWVVDEKTGERRLLINGDNRREQWLQFLPTFLTSLHQHLQANGWLGIYVQHLYDEPRDYELYRRLVEMTHQCMPGVQTIDAINAARQDLFTPLVDMQVFNLVGLVKYETVAAQRRASGRAVWLYHCTSPYPPYPNRHLDNALTECRLWPWLCAKLGASGFLYWGANIYRGADEYKTSIGPFPNGSQDPGHPPGDNWFYYRGPDGLRPSMRIVSFREGLIDYALLSALRGRDSEAQGELVDRIAASPTSYCCDPAAYHAARTQLLELLSGD